MFKYFFNLIILNIFTLFDTKIDHPEDFTKLVLTIIKFGLNHFKSNQ